MILVRYLVIISANKDQKARLSITGRHEKTA